MTGWQTDIVDTQRKALAALEKLLDPYDHPVVLEARGLVVWLEPSGATTDTPTHYLRAPVETSAWREVVRLTDSLARMGYFTTRGYVSRNGVKWAVTCRRSREGYVAPALGGVSVDRKNFETPTIGETTVVVRHHPTGRETVVQGGAVQVTELQALTVITVWGDMRDE